MRTPFLAAALVAGVAVLPVRAQPAGGADAVEPSNAGLSPADTAKLPELPAPYEAESETDGDSSLSEKSGGAEPSPSDLAYGAFQRGLYLTALELATPLANLGDPAAQTLLGEIYSRGLGTAQDLKEAMRWYKAAAETGNAEGQFRYGLMLLDGTAHTDDGAEAKENGRELMKKAADQGLPLAQYNYAQIRIQASPSGGFEQALAYFQKAADAGVPDAQYAMSQLYAYGRGVHADDAKAREWLRSAAINGQTTAQIEYGIWLINGKGGPADVKSGFRFLKGAADLGNPIAINRVAHLFKDGIGTKPDRLEAAKWALLAKRVENTDPVLDDFFRGLDPATQKSALEAANRFRSG